MNIFSLHGKTALVVGASRGIGLAMAEAIAEAGAKTILAARSLDLLEQRVAAIREKGFEAEPLRLDLADPDSIQQGVAAAGDVDVLVNVAGINIRKRFEQYTPEEYAKVLQTNLHGIVLLTQKAGARMIERGKGGKIIMIGSMTSLLGLPYLTVYGITKSGIAGLTRTLAAEWGRYGIQVNCIAPGMIETDLNRAVWAAEGMMNWYKGVASNPRLGKPADVAPLAVFLAGQGADYITGQVIAVDGGYSTTAVWPFEP